MCLFVVCVIYALLLNVLECNPVSWTKQEFVPNYAPTSKCRSGNLRLKSMSSHAM